MGDKEPTSPNEKTPTLIGVSLTWQAITHRGLMRSQNEDSFCVASSVEEESDSVSSLRYLFAIADGLGGHRGGAIASQIALKSVKDEFHKWHSGNVDSLVDRAMQKANEDVFIASHSEPELFTNMQTTLTVVALAQSSLIVGHVGDCRLYRLRNGRIDVLTRDHTMAQDLLHLHLISPEQASLHPGRHQLTRSVGSEPNVHRDMIREQVQPDDTYLLCSDGLWGDLANDDIKKAMEDMNINAACDRLVRLALNAGAPDNITAIMFRIHAVGKPVNPLFSLLTVRRGAAQVSR